MAVPMDMRFADSLADEDIQRGIDAARELAELTAAEPEGEGYEIKNGKPHALAVTLGRRISYMQGSPDFAAQSIDFTDLSWLDYGDYRDGAFGSADKDQEGFKAQFLNLIGCADWALQQFIEPGKPFLGAVKFKVVPHLLKAWVSYFDSEPQIIPLAPEFIEWLAAIKRPGGNGDWIQGRDDEDIEFAIGSIEVYSLPPVELTAWEQRYRSQAWPKVHLE